MTTDLRLTDGHDLYINNGDLAILSDSEQIAQALKIQLLTFLGEWFLDTRLGIDYLNIVFSSETSASAKREEMLRGLMLVEGVASINNLSMIQDPDNNRRAIVSFNYADIHGNTGTVST